MIERKPEYWMPVVRRNNQEVVLPIMFDKEMMLEIKDIFKQVTRVVAVSKQPYVRRFQW